MFDVIDNSTNKFNVGTDGTNSGTNGTMRNVMAGIPLLCYFRRTALPSPSARTPILDASGAWLTNTTISAYPVQNSVSMDASLTAIYVNS